MPEYSNSQIGTFEECPLQYRLIRTENLGTRTNFQRIGYISPIFMVPEFPESSFSFDSLQI